jgi:sporulation protein YlmC with PRC-barrel domain
MKQKHLATLGALAITMPAFALAQVPTQPPDPDDDRRTTEQYEDRDMGRDTGMHHDADRQRGQQITRLARDHVKLEQLRGQEVMGPGDEELGTIEDLIVDRKGQVVAVLISEGGVMGIGEEQRAISWDQINVERDQDDEYRITTQMSQQEFQALPEFQDDDDNGLMQ